QLFAAAVHLALELLDQRDLLGIVAYIALEPRHELARAAPLIFIDAPVLFLQPDREAAERRLGARDRGVDRTGLRNDLHALRLPAERAVVIVVGASEQQDERPDHTGQDRAEDDRQPEANTLPPPVIFAVDIPHEHAHLLPDKRTAAKHGRSRGFNSPRKGI